MMNFKEAYDLTGDKELAIELMKVEAEKAKVEALQEFVSEIRYSGIRVRINQETVLNIGEIKVTLNDNMQEIHDLVENQTITKITLYDHIGYEGEKKSTISSLDEVLQDGQDVYVYGYKSDTGFTFKDIIVKAKAKHLRNIGVRKPLQGVYINTDTGRYSFGVFAFIVLPFMVMR